MSNEMLGFGNDDDFMNGYVTEERAEEFFLAGAQQMRELLARFVEQDGHAALANSIRLNWVPNWGKDPGKPDEVHDDIWKAV